MECLKNCCKTVMRRSEKEQETQVITLKMPPAKPAGESRDGTRGVTEDYLLSKLPPDGRVVPFVLPTFKPSYIQPGGPRYPNLQSGQQGSARIMYTERKAELLGTALAVYNPESSFHHGQVLHRLSPGPSHRDTLKTRSSSPQSPGRNLTPDKEKLSSSMFDLSSPHSPMQCFDSYSSVLSNTSSMMGSVESSLGSITLSGDEHELGRVCVRLSYHEALEQVWITLVQCSDLCLPGDGVEQQTLGFKGIITVPKPIHFKSSIKEFYQDVVFMETFVFAIRLQQLRCTALVLRLQTQHPKKRTVAECVLSLRQLSPQETDHWLDLSLPSKSSASHSEVQLASCFQPICGRIQLQVLAAQNLPSSSSPLTQEIIQQGQMVIKKKTRVLKAKESQCRWAETFQFPLPPSGHDFSLSVRLYSRSCVRRKQCLGQVQLGFDSPITEAVAQWADTMSHPEKVVSVWHRLSGS